MKNTCILSYLLLLCLGLLGCKEAYFEPLAQGALQGEILTATDLAPIANASIQLSPNVGSLLSDEQGVFSLDDLEVGKYTLEIKKAGYRTELSSVEILASQTTNIVVLLEEDILLNTPPGHPFNPEPNHQSTMQSTQQWLTWEVEDADAEDVLNYTVYLFAEGEPSDQLYLEQGTENQLEVRDLKYGTTYFWQVVVDDGQAEKVYGPIWEFKTEPFPEHRFAWVRTVDGKSQIFSSDEEGNALQLTTTNAHFWRPRISPNRQHIAYISNQELEPQLFLMDSDGKNARQLSQLSINSGDPTSMNYCWVSDGATLLYIHRDQLLSINKDGSGLKVLLEAPAGETFASVDWTPFGNQMVLRTIGGNAYDSAIYLWPLSGALEKIVDKQAGKTGNPVFSIDGKQILYTQDLAGFENAQGRQLDSHIFLMDLSSGLLRDLSTEKPAGSNDLDPRFSPNGAEVIFTNKENDDQSPGQIYRMNLQGENRLLLFDNAEMVDWR